MSFLKRYIEFHINGFRDISHVLLISLPPGRLFALLFNLGAIMLGRSIRLTWTDQHYVITARDMPHSRMCMPASGHKQMLTVYNLGMRKRAAYMASVYFLHHIKFAKGDLVLDCGAHIGDLRLAFDLMGVKICYIGFEPSPDEFACLKQNVTQNKTGMAEAHNIGLWHKKGELPFYVSSRGADSSFIKPTTYTDIIKIPVLPISQFIAGRVKLLKLEAEGAELEVLQGAGNKLRQIEYICADLGKERGIKQEATFVPVTNFLLARGFELVDAFPPHRPHNALFRNTKLGAIEE